MLAVVTLFVIVFISLLITRIGSVALNLTGVSKDLAYFQAFRCLCCAIVRMEPDKQRPISASRTEFDRHGQGKGSLKTQALNVKY